MKYKEQIVNLRNEIVCGIQSVFEQIENDTYLFFNEPINSSTLADNISGEVINIDGFYKDGKGRLVMLVITDGSDMTPFQMMNTEDLGDALDILNAKEYEITKDVD